MAGFAFAGENMRINVPFAFYMGDQLFPAGRISVRHESRQLCHGLFRQRLGSKGRGQQLLMTTAGTDKNTTANQLVFNKYGQKFFLSTVSINGYKAALKALSLERELRSQAEKAPGIITVAQK